MNACILIVEDDMEIRQFLTMILEEHGYRSVTASGTDARATAAREHPDLVLLDLFMPAISGQEVREDLAADPTTADIPIIVISAVSEAPLIAQAMDVEGVLQKPFNLQTLEETIHKALARARARRGQP